MLEAERGYLLKLGVKAPKADSLYTPPEQMHQEMLKAMQASARGEILAYGPRGGKRWSPRYFVRREAWHVLDHLWEIEDRLETTIV